MFKVSDLADSKKVPKVTAVANTLNYQSGLRYTTSPKKSCIVLVVVCPTILFRRGRKPQQESIGGLGSNG
jgi:hypothetical protein